MDDYISALASQLATELEGRTTPFYSVYFGGGTPSMLSVRQFDKIFKTISLFLSADTEVTVEANPSSWSKEKATALKSMGVNRLSLGIQSLNDDKLSFLSRAHNAKQALGAYELSRAAGFSNISVDFMYDTPFDDEKFVNAELADFLTLAAEHISAYSLTIEENTPFEKQNIKTRYDAKIANDIAAALIEAGYEHYEVASFGRIRSKHNFGYWEYREYIGVGAGAVGFDGKARYYPHKSIEEYVKEPLFKDMEPLTDEDARVERILLGLRSGVGVSKSLILKDKDETIKALLDSLMVSEAKEKIYCRDYFLADEIASRLI